MALYTVILLVTFLTGSDFSYEGWAGMFARQWFKIATFVTLLVDVLSRLGRHARHLDGLCQARRPRLLLQSATILWLIGCAGYAAQILWRV
jgi:succinate dehydrogenase / fumarate reductase membrane anchor subunit